MGSLLLKICLTGTLAKVFPAYGEGFWNGALMGVESAGGSPKTVLVEKHFYDQNPLAAAKAMDEMVTSGCHAVIGFDFTNDLMLIRDKAKASSMLVVSTYGASNAALDATESIRTLQVPPAQLITLLLDYTDKKLVKKLSSVLIVTTIDLDELKTFRDEAKVILDGRKVAVQFVSQVEATFNVNEVKEAMKGLKQAPDAVLLFTRSRPAAEIADAVYEFYPAGRRPLILGTKFFGTSTLPAFTNMLKHKDVESYFTHQTSNEDPDPSYQTFVKSYREKYKLEPMGLSALALDAVSFVLKSANKAKLDDKMDPPTARKNILLAAKETSFDGVTGVSVKPGLKFEYRKTFVVRTSAKGYAIAD